MLPFIPANNHAQVYLILAPFSHLASQKKITAHGTENSMQIQHPPIRASQTTMLMHEINAKVSVCTESDPFDDINLVPYDRMPLLPDPDLTIDLTVYMKVLDNGADYSMFKNISYIKLKVPTL